MCTCVYIMLYLWHFQKCIKNLVDAIAFNYIFCAQCAYRPAHNNGYLNTYMNCTLYVYIKNIYAIQTSSRILSATDS